MATFIKGEAVANATSYELLEKTVGGEYSSLAEASEINFELDALGLAVGDHTMVVKAKADGYEDSDPSNAVTYTVAESGPVIVTNSYDTSGFYIAKADGTETSSNSWIHSDLIDITTLANNADGFCTSNLLGHSKVANIGYYSSNDLGSYISCVSQTAGDLKRYTVEEIQEAAPEGTAFVNFSTHVNNRPLQVTALK